MAIQHLGKKKGFTTDEWFPNLDGLEIKDGKYPRQAADSHRKIWEALYWLRRRGQKQDEAVGGGASSKISFTPFLPANYGLIGIQDLASLAGAAPLNGNGKLDLDIVLAQVDEGSASDNYAVTGGADATTDPMLLVPNSILGSRFTLNRYVVWNDPDEDTVNVPDPLLMKPNRRKYEVSRIVKIEDLGGGNKRWTLTRGLLGTFKVAHANEIRVYPLDLIYNQAESGSGDLGGKAALTAGKPAPAVVVSPNGCVVSVVARLAGGIFTAVATAPLAYPFPGPFATSQSILPPAPGMRTLTGAEYTMCINGALSVGQFIPCPIHVSEGAAPRVVYAEVRVPPAGVQDFAAVEGLVSNAAIVLYVLFIEAPVPAQNDLARKVGIVAQLSIPAGVRVSYPLSVLDPDPPKGRRQPYSHTWPFSTLKGVGVFGDLFATDGTLKPTALPLVFSGQDVTFAQDGELFTLVAHVGMTTPGSDLSVEVQT